MEKASKRQVREVLEQKFTVNNKLGLHARPAALLVQTANRFQSEISLQKGKQRVNAKSIMGVLMLAAGAGSVVTIRIEGSDARKAMLSITKMFQQNLQE